MPGVFNTIQMFIGATIDLSDFYLFGDPIGWAPRQSTEASGNKCDPN